MLTTLKRKILFWFSIIAFFALMPVVIAYSLGYRFDDSWRLRKTGGLYVTSDITGSEIFLDDRLMKTTNLLQSGTFIDNLSPGSYKITILKKNYLSWEKTLEVRSQLVTESKALLIPEKDNTKVIAQGNFFGLESSIYNPLLLFSEDKGEKKIVRWFLPVEGEFIRDTGPLVKYDDTFELVRWLPRGVVLSLDGKIRRIAFDLGAKTATIIPLGDELPSKNDVEKEALNARLDDRKFVRAEYLENEGILKASWLENTIYPYYFSDLDEILIHDKKIRDFEFYPGRSDALIAAYGNGIWALEIDKRGGRNIFSIYKGREPEFKIPYGLDSIYALDAGNLISIKLALD